MQITDYDPDAPADQAKTRRVLDEAMGELADTDRDAVALRFFEERSFAEIGHALQLSDEAVRKRIDRALAKMQTFLAHRGVTSTAAALAVALANQTGVAAPSGLAANVTASALASANTVGVVGLNIFATMSTTKVILVTIAVAAICSNLYQVRKAHLAEDALIAVAAERDDMAKRLEAEQKQNKQPQVRVAATSNRDLNSRGASGNQMRFGPPNIGALLRDPIYRKLQETTEWAKLDGRYAALFKALGLGSSQLTQFKNLLVEKQMAVTDAVGAARELGVTQDAHSQEFRQAILNAGDLVEKEIKTALGDAAYAQYQQYQQTQPERDVVNQLQRSLSYTPTPLTEDQVSQLIQILQQAAPEQLDKGNPTSTVVLMANGLTNFITPAYTVTDQALAAAQIALSPDQMQALRQIQSQQQAQRQMSLLAGGKPPP